MVRTPAGRSIQESTFHKATVTENQPEDPQKPSFANAQGQAGSTEGLPCFPGGTGASSPSYLGSETDFPMSPQPLPEDPLQQWLWPEGCIPWSPEINPFYAKPLPLWPVTLKGRPLLTHFPPWTVSSSRWDMLCIFRAVWSA